VSIRNISWQSLLNWYHRKFNAPYKLAVRYNDGSGQPVILLHGIASDSGTWSKLYPLLYPAYHCIAIDLLGFGQSPKPDWSSYSIDQHIASIHKTIISLNLQTPFILVGHSMGSLLAAHYTRRYPEEVKRLYMLSPPMMANLVISKKLRLKVSTNAYARMYRYLREHKRFTLSAVNRIRKLLHYQSFTMTESYWISFVRSLEECIEKQTAIGQDLAHIICPIDVFYGEKDRIISKTNVRSLALIKNVSLHEVDAWHRLNQTYADAVARQLSYAR
jgi:pimeloyl-ACP methyl ester carboxylesterase